MRTRTEPAWATDHRISPSCGTWHSTSCRRMARRRRCAASFSGPDGTTPISPASWLYSEVQLPCHDYTRGSGLCMPLAGGLHLFGSGSARLGILKIVSYLLRTSCYTIELTTELVI